jgi:hypothetical protein
MMVNWRLPLVKSGNTAMTVIQNSEPASRRMLQQPFVALK